tara:strand:+ start:2844 stop:3359 length:516 start_codon:yes stop_codon:yes gene_type:complete
MELTCGLCELCNINNADSSCTICKIKVCSEECMKENWKKYKSQCKKKWKIKNASNKSENCIICAENMIGRVTLKCSHEMCPSCFARHSRLSNTCPFCRDEFAPPVKKREEMPENIAEEIMMNDVYHNFMEEIITDLNDQQQFNDHILSIILTHHCNSTMRVVEEVIDWHSN